MEDLAEQLALRDRFMRRRWEGQTWEERLAAVDRFQSAAWEALRLSPDGYAHFIRRNYKARATDWVEPTGGQVA